jgi:LysM repeat protein
MPIANPQDLDTFTLGPAYLKATSAPEDFKEGVTAAFRFFFYKNKPTIVQKGRVTPDPITLSFKFNGDLALDTARYLRGLVAAQQPINLTWAGRFSFTGYLLKFDFSYRQKEVTGTLTYQPTAQDTGAVPGLLPSMVIDPATLLTAVQGFMAGITDGIAAMTNDINSLQNSVNDLLQPLTDLNAALTDAVKQVQANLYNFGDIVSMPYQTLSALADTIGTALGLMPTAYQEITNKVTNPVVSVLTATDAYIAAAIGADYLAHQNDAEVNALLLQQALTPTPITYTVQADDTLQLISSYFSVSVGAMLQLNPGLSELSLVPGSKILVPPNG